MLQLEAEARIEKPCNNQFRLIDKLIGIERNGGKVIAFGENVKTERRKTYNFFSALETDRACSGFVLG